MYQADLPEIVLHNQTALSNLKRALTLGQGQFSLILVRANYQRLTQLLLKDLAQTQTFHTVELSAATRSLPEAIVNSQAALESSPAAVMVTGFDQVKALDVVFKAANVGRNALLAKFPYPLVLWMTNPVLQSLTLYAADLKSFAAVPIQVDYPIQSLIEALHRAANEIFTYILDSHDAHWLHEAAPPLPSLSHHLKILTEQELPFAIADLKQHNVQLDGALQASLNFLQGREAHTPERLKVAREYYEQSLDYWIQTDKTVEDTSDQQAVLLLHLGLWWQTHGKLQPSTQLGSYRQARRFYERFINTLRQQEQCDRTANFIHILAEILQKLEDWDALTAVANEGLDLHQNDPVRLARDYGYLAEADLARENWVNAQQLATTALTLLAQAVKSTHPLETTANDRSAGTTPAAQISPQALVFALRYRQGRYYFLRGQAKLRQGDETLFDEALHDLENARQRTDPRHDFPLYRHILQNLQDLYFAKKRYLDAFATKQEQRQVENLMGLRAFIGASPIQPYRAPSARAVNEISTVEMRASGRQQEIEHLVGRLMQPQHTLVILHGQSGVGKSSLLSSGLVPALKQATSEGRTTLPLLVRTYTSWEISILQALQRVTSSLPSAPPNFQVSFPITGESLLNHLRQHAQNNYQQIIIIFDQFEEFFFEQPGVEQRRSLYAFLRDCLNSPYLKVVLALRNDYLHYLLEWERLANLDLDILSRDVRYYLSNFTPKECEAVIRQLTDNAQFYLEESLITALVNDLTADNGEVRPIELQLVGAELQRENITTLRRYEQLGDGPIRALVLNFLNRVVRDCGPENSILARTILYLLSDESTIRPLKTRAELEESLESLGVLVDPAQLSLVLEILAESGLLFESPEVGGRMRYQLAHDYLADLVKQQDMPGLMAMLQAERRRRKQTETQLRTALQEQALALAQATEERYRAETAEMQALASVSQALLLSHDGLGALLESLKGAQQSQLTPVSGYLHNQILFRLWQALHTVREKNRIHAHQDWVLSACFSPDGQYLASSSDDGTVRLWNSRGKLLQVLTGHQGSVLEVAFNQDSTLIGSAGDDFSVRIWDMSGQCLQILTGHTGAVNSVAFSPTQKLIASASNDHTVKLWSQDGQWLKTLEGHLDWVRSVTFSSDGQHLVSAAEDGTLCLWNSEGELLRAISSHAGWVLKAVFSPDGQHIVSGGDDHLIKLWSLNGELLQYFEGHQNWIRDLCFSPDGARLISASDDQNIHVWDLDGQLLDTLKGHRSSVLSLGINPQGTQLISASDDNTIRIWQLQSRDIPSLWGHHGIIWDLCWQPNGSQLVSAGADQTLKVWQSSDGQNHLLHSIHGHDSSIYSVDWSPDGKLIASASADHTVKLWTATGQPVHTFEGHHNAVWAVKFSPDGTYLASAGSDRNIRLWYANGTPIGQLSGHGGTVWTVTFSPDGRYLISGSEDGTLRRWDLTDLAASGIPITSTVLSGHTGSVWAVAVSPDGETIASAGSDNTVRLWQNGELLDILRGHHDWVRSVSFGLGGDVIASASDDGTIRFWQLPDGQLLHTLTGHRGIIWQGAFNSSGDHLASAGADGQIRLWNLQMQNLMRQGCRWIEDYLAYGDLSDGERWICEDIWE
ncbi:wd40 repeat-containing protein [Leptolyngbya sp. Heron Island J]|uniref:WD40 repeat domain-containing protein n=1 Tax=Leptolyngbya sp. Heron Island J TaxID=1385935 RepID=UPI0003B9B3AD|nr:WD40 repeat domain-containing protein [Leptolyngbya sp. Heron Island J]ESA32937.1 wd40 repeat-containing protein [Leptolyngbya sp. Heron Island J]